MGYVDEVLFGREVIDRLPELVDHWVALRPQAEARAREHQEVEFVREPGAPDA
jgi:hypothetical protein